MSSSTSTALITNQGRQVLLQVFGKLYSLSQDELRAVLKLPEGAPGLGISIDGDSISFEFVDGNHTVELSTTQLKRRLAKHLSKNTRRGAPSGTI